ncbi:hypothetical protein PGT21_022410 [Puccinia graminis f. sp. tritici]|uniref:Secreted protein n=1 Tax=Puccinia graminis f. sp. tritici TaxID=56615 RepID=A0A5B0SH64_PUCGR|nr:hypothetical protein PGT21_022410 [Puccinia graminis f. sp. tritici]KAA1098785.1 hypothetical protein PGTUg99_017614 [Puccinia graminis f. sp. tritici]KAA1137311.1 hypothetical protein PGTUg99_002807 [Puccinia graminis f. sp. tritici]
MSTMNVCHRGSVAFVLVTLIITLYSGHVAAGTKQQCSYHFSPTSSKGKGASCMQNDKDDMLCVLDSCKSDANGLKCELQYVIAVVHHDGHITPETVKPAQYFRRDKIAGESRRALTLMEDSPNNSCLLPSEVCPSNSAEVQIDGTDKWVQCGYSSATDYQMTCSDCSPQAKQNGPAVDETVR